MDDYRNVKRIKTEGGKMKRNIIQRGLARAGYKGYMNWIPDSLYLKLMFWARLGLKLNYSNPKTLNEKVQLLKLKDRKKEYIKWVDKYSVRQYIEDKIGRDYLIPLIGGPWNKFEDIDFDKLPDQFVLKCTHDSGGLVICTDKSTLNFEEAKNKINKSLNNNYYWSGREWPYKQVPPQIIAEKYMVDKSGTELKDYKILCFNGKPDNIMICTGRNSSRGVKYYFFSPDWQFLRYNYGDEDLPEDFTISPPDNLNEMLDIARKLSFGTKLSRIDLYEADGRVWFGEITLYPDSGFDTDILPSTDLLFGKKMDVSEYLNR